MNSNYSRKSQDGKLLNSFYEATITLIPKPEKDSTKKENYWPVLLNTLVNIDAEIFWQLLEKRIQ